MEQRTKIFLGHPLQKLAILYTSFLVVLICFIYYFANLYFFRSFHLFAEKIKMPLDHPLHQFMAQQETLMIIVFAVTTLVILLMTNFWLISFTNRIVGPVLRITAELKKMTDDGHPIRLQIRKKDFFSELVNAINKLIEKHLIQKRSQSHDGHLK